MVIYISLFTNTWLDMDISNLTRIEGFDHYFIDKLGNVYRRKLSKVTKVKKFYYKGRNFVILYKNSKRHRMSVPRLMLMTFQPQYNPAYYAARKSRNTKDDRLSNLYWNKKQFNLVFLEGYRKLWHKPPSDKEMLELWKLELKRNKDKIKGITR